MNVKIFLLSLLLCFLCSPSLAQPRIVTSFGILDAIHHEGNYVVISDMTYSMALNLKVFNHREAEQNRYAIKPKQKVRFEYTAGQPNQLILHKVWVLPDDAVFPKPSDEE